MNRGSIAILSVVVIGTLLLDLISFALVRHLPEDAVFNLGPVLGLLKEGRMVDLLVYKEFDTYYGYPPLFFAPQVLWYGLLGISSNTVWGWVVFVHIALLVCFVLVFRSYARDNIALSMLTVCYCSGVYYLSGRPDPVVLLLIFPLVGCLLKLISHWKSKHIVLASLLLVTIFFVHPLAFALSAFVFFSTLTLVHGRARISVLVLAGATVVMSILMIYVPFIMTDLVSWKALFLGLAKDQERFKIASFFKFVALNAGLFLAIIIVFVTGGIDFLNRLIRDRLFIVAMAAMAIPFLWGASYYFLFVLPFVFAGVIRLLGDEYQWSTKSWFFLSLCALLSLYQGSLGKITQGLREPGYGEYLVSARAKARESISSNSTVYADSQLIAELTHVSDLNLLWHGMKYYRDDYEKGSSFVFVNEGAWVANKRMLGNWNDSTRYQLVYQGKSSEGLPVLYRRAGTGPPLQLRIVEEIK